MVSLITAGNDILVYRHDPGVRVYISIYSNIKHVNPKTPKTVIHTKWSGHDNYPETYEEAMEIVESAKACGHIVSQQTYDTIKYCFKKFQKEQQLDLF